MLITRTDQAEIISPDQRVDVYVRPSPLRQEALHLAVAAGASLQEIVEEARAAFRISGADRYLHVTLNGHVVEHQNWARVRVKPGVTVNVVRVPSGAFRNLLAAVVAVFAAIAAPWLATAFGFIAGTAAYSTAVTVIGAGITMAGALAVNALFPPAKPGEDKTTPLYSIGGGQNQAAQFGAIPFVFGTHRLSPPYASGPYSDLSGSDQYLRLLFCLGYGPMQISDIKIGETPIDDFDGISYRVIENHLTEALTLYTQPTYEESLSILLTKKDGWSSRTTAERVDEVSVDISFPSGIYRYKDDGDKVRYTVEVLIQYRNVDSGSWMGAGTVKVTSSSTQAIRRTVRWSVPNGQYEVRVRKASSDYEGGDTVSETTYWSALRARRVQQVIRFDKPLSFIEMRIKASNELSGTVDRLNCMASMLIRKWNGAEWIGGQVTSNPADHFREVLQGTANARPVADEAIDLAGLQEWHDYCREKGFTFNLVTSEALSVYERLTQIAAAGRAAVSLRDGKWGVVWDREDDVVVQHFTPRNSWGFSSTRAYVDLPHGFRMAFINAKNGYLNDERIVYDDGYSESNATKFEGLDFPGVVDPDLIWRHGRFQLAQLRLQRETYSLNTDFENLVCTRGDRVRVNHDVVLWGAGAARVKQVSSSPDTVTIDDTFTMEAGKTYSMRFRLADGSSLVRTIVGVAGEHSVFTLHGEGALPAKGDLLMFGQNGFESVVLRVKSVQAQPDLTAKLELVDDAPAITQADKGTIPPFETGIPPLVNYQDYAPSQLVVIEEVESVVPPRSVLRLSWTAPTVAQVQSYLTQIALKGSEDWSQAYISSIPSVDIPNIEAGLYDVRVRAMFQNGQPSGWLFGTAEAGIFRERPAPVTGFRVAVAGDVAILQWDEQTDPAVSHYQIRFTSSLVGASWVTASSLREKATGNQVVVPAMRGTYLIRAVSRAGATSAEDAMVVNGIDPMTSFNAIETVTESPTFPGERDRTHVLGSTLRLLTAGDFFAPLDFFAADDFFLSGGGYEPIGYYEFDNVIDLGQVYTSRVSADIRAFGERAGDDVFERPDFFAVTDFFGVEIGDTWGVRVEVSTTPDDPAGSPVWSDWTQLIAGDVSARAYRFRAVLRSGQFDITPVVTVLSASVDMPDRVVAESDLAVSTAGRVISFTPPFHSLQGISIAAQGMASGDYYQISGKSNAGFTIIFRNASGTPVARTLDYVAKGYGTRQ
jgi:hypothetical protein